MSEQSKRALKLRLQLLNCHFTWRLYLKYEDCTNYEALEDSLYDQLTFLVTKNKYMVYNLLAYVMHLKEDYMKAKTNLEKAEELIKNNNPDGTHQNYLVTYGNYAWVFYYLNQYEDCHKYIDKVEQIYKELKDTQDVAEIYGEKAWSLIKFGGQYYEEAKKCFQKALELEPEDPEWNSGYATVVYRLEDFNDRQCPECESLPLLENAVVRNPNDAVVKALLALKLQDLDRTYEGVKYVEEAIEQAPGLPYLLRYIAKFYRRAGMLDEALRVLNTAVDLTPSSGFLHHQIGLCYRSKYFNFKKQFKDRNNYNREMDRELNDLLRNCIFHFKKVLELKKTFVYAYTDLAKIYCEAKEYQKAEDTFQIVFAFPNLLDEEKQQLYYHYGNFKKCMKSESEAIIYYKKSLQITLPMKDREFSEKCLKEIASKKINLNIPDPEGFALLGFIYKTNGERNNAIDCYEKALKYDPNNEEYVSELLEMKLKV